MAKEKELRLKICQLEAQLKESHELVQRICYWINTTHNILIPPEVIYNYNKPLKIIAKPPEQQRNQPPQKSQVNQNGTNPSKIIFVKFKDLIPQKNEQFYDESENDPLQDLPSPNTPPSPPSPLSLQNSSPPPIINPPPINLPSIKIEDYSSVCKPCIVSLPRLEDFLRARLTKMRAEGIRVTNKGKVARSRYPFTPKMEQEVREFLDSDFFKGNPKSVDCHLCPRTINTHVNLKGLYKKHLWSLHRVNARMYYKVNRTASWSAHTWPEPSLIQRPSVRTLGPSKPPIDKKAFRSQVVDYEMRAKCIDTLKSLPPDIPPHKRKISAKSPATCPVCNASFNSYAVKSHFKVHLIKLHKLKIEKDEPRGYTAFDRSKYPNLNLLCDTCGKSCKTLGGFKKHKESHLAPPKIKLMERFLCPLCGKSNATKQASDIHIAMVHATDTPYECNTCQKSFKHPIILKMHQRSMHGDQELLRKFVCDHCGKRFKFNDTLRKHVKHVHMGIRPFSCTLEGCDKSFKHKTHLNYHLNTHSNPNSKKRGLNRPKNVNLY